MRQDPASQEATHPGIFLAAEEVFIRVVANLPPHRAWPNAKGLEGARPGET